jgi:hypothetical protein
MHCCQVRLLRSASSDGFTLYALLFFAAVGIANGLPSYGSVCCSSNSFSPSQGFLPSLCDVVGMCLVELLSYSLQYS